MGAAHRNHRRNHTTHRVGKDFAGPTGDRKCTDVLWFLLLLAHWFSITYLAFVAFGWIGSEKIGQGRPQILTNWIDHNGYICGKEGHDGAVEGKPYLYFPNPLGRLYCSSQDCDDIDQAVQEASGIYFVQGGPNDGDVASSAYGICVKDCPNAEGEKVYDYTACDDDGDCNYWNSYDSTRFVNYCIPSMDSLEIEDDATEESANAVFSFFQEIFGDIIASRVPIAVCGLVMPFACGFLYMVILRVPGVLFTLVWGSIVMVFCVIIAIGSVCWDNYEKLKDVDDDEVDKENDTYESASMYFAYIFWALACIYMCFVCCMRKAIMLAMGIVKEAAVAVNDMMAIVLLPFVQGGAIVTFLVIWFVYCVYVATAGEKKLTESDSFGKVQMPYQSYDISDNQMYALWYLLFDAFWTMEFVAALGQLIIATAAATYYFTRDKSTINSTTVVFAFKHSVLYHAGTAAMGSLIIGILKWVKAFLLYVQKNCEKAIASTGDSCPARTTKQVAKAVFCAFQCCLWCLEKCMKVLNKEAYIQTAIFGYAFCTAARKGFFLVLRNIRRVAALEAVGNFIFFITKVLISATCALACFVWMGQYYREETHSITYPTLLVAAMAFHLGAIFVGVVDMVADTLLICFIADEEIYGEGDDNCFATPGLRGYIEGHPNHVKTPKAGGDKGDDKL